MWEADEGGTVKWVNPDLPGVVRLPSFASTLVDNDITCLSSQMVWGQSTQHWTLNSERDALLS